MRRSRRRTDGSATGREHTLLSERAAAPRRWRYRPSADHRIVGVRYKSSRIKTRGEDLDESDPRGQTLRGPA